MNQQDFQPLDVAEENRRVVGVDGAGQRRDVVQKVLSIVNPAFFAVAIEKDRALRVIARNSVSARRFAAARSRSPTSNISTRVALLYHCREEGHQSMDSD